MPATAGFGTCGICMTRAIGKDVFGMGWCEQHAHRIKTAAWGKDHHYLAVHFPPFAIAEGIGYWKHAIATYREKALLHIHDSIQSLDAQTTAQDDISQKGA